MLISENGHLSYCTNIHAGESWCAVFESIVRYCIPLKKEVSPDKPFGIGLRLSHQAATELMLNNNIQIFKKWLLRNEMYVFTLNGFPYGNFHNEPVKDKVHLPDWTSNDRLNYTQLLFTILGQLLPPGIEGGISTSPLSYKHWHTTEASLIEAKQIATKHLVAVVAQLAGFYEFKDIMMHLDIEPEPDGIIENSDEYIAFFEDYLLKEGATLLATTLVCSLSQAQEHMRNHIQLCYDVCHFAIGFEKSEEVLQKMENHGLKIGKLQISAALKCTASASVPIDKMQQCLRSFDEPTYLHQAVIKTTSGELLKFNDLSKGIEAMKRADFKELRTHFHVPIFIEDYQLLQSTQNDITDILESWRKKEFTQHLEIETYTWQVLPVHLQADLTESIERELKWVINRVTDEVSVI
ncbi:metabolite traffic protein EboE [Flavobacterium sp. LS1R47]|uniref:Metabolite traffic protein EboE n=1 Tax=Flavobacterium frigoritolerans TaxID=2987686 RepID=A0A9X3C9A5_9FLAO|nr:metabolite traffic protein EboE [Flavobacterium frigoritolerans]MCV9933943.1 metabolite traffic protein EboE [Flavobacterium frigoritolerans]